MTELSGAVAAYRHSSRRLSPGTQEVTVAEREQLLAGVFVRLADTLVDDFDVVEFLQGLCADSKEVLGAEAAGVMLASRAGAGLRLVASSDERMRLLELFELQSEQGPCLEAFSTGEPVQVSAAQASLSWPSFAPTAAREGFLAMCAVPLQIRGNVIGALNLFRATDEAFTDVELILAQAMAQVAAIGLLQQRSISERDQLAEQLAVALKSRVVIEQAKGILAESLAINVDEAFEVLRRHARNTNTKLTALARDVADRRVRSDAFGRVHAP